MEYTNKITGKTYSSPIGLANSLRFLNITVEEYYRKYCMKPGEDECPCGQSKLQFTGLRNGFRKYCSDKCPVIMETRRQAVIHRFECDNREEKLKSAHAWRKTFDFTPMIERRKKLIEKKAKKLGMTVHEYHSKQAKKGAQSISKEQRKEISLKRMETISKRNSPICSSNYKDYVLRGKTIRVQGYEPHILDFLQANTESEIIAGGKPLHYSYRWSKDNSEHLHFPDIYLPEQKMFIEVKSEYTFAMHKEICIDKMIGAPLQGYKYFLLVFAGNNIRDNGLSPETQEELKRAISSQANFDVIHLTDKGEGSTTIRKGVVPSGTKCRDSLRECDIVWSNVKALVG